MSYHVYIFRKEVKEVEVNSCSKDFFKGNGNILPFSSEQRKKLKDRLLRYDYKISSEFPGRISFEKEADKATAALTDLGLYFSASGSGIFEISMTASEFTDTGEFVKYDPQNCLWESN
ncbi:MAG: hypothetical protein LBU32_12220 [Clostridiales bacterium]|nr:hypothetical protein [Clostridiales bacterium]